MRKINLLTIDRSKRMLGQKMSVAESRGSQF